MARDFTMFGPGVMTAKRSSLAKRIVTSGDRLFSHPRFIVVAFLIVVGMTLLQYARFGSQLLLGWDSSYYVYFTTLIDQYGLATMVQQWSYPQLYVLVLWAFGHAVGDPSLAERLLPFVWLAVLFVAYERITLRLTKDRRLTNFALLVTPLTLSTITIFSTLNRTLMSFSLSMVAVLMITDLAPNLLRPRRANLVLFVVLLAIASTELETYLVLGLGVILSLGFRRELRAFVEAAVFLAIPVLLLLPLILSFVVGYLPAQAFPSNALALDLNTALIFGAGSAAAAPFLALGIWRAYGEARKGSRLAALVVGWVLALAILFVILMAGIVELPAVRVLYILPAPPLLALGVPEFETLLRRWWHSRLPLVRS